MPRDTRWVRPANWGCSRRSGRATLHDTAPRPSAVTNRREALVRPGSSPRTCTTAALTGVAHRPRALHTRSCRRRAAPGVLATAGAKSSRAKEPRCTAWYVSKGGASGVPSPNTTRPARVIAPPSGSTKQAGNTRAATWAAPGASQDTGSQVLVVPVWASQNTTASATSTASEDPRPRGPRPRGPGAGEQAAATLGGDASTMRCPVVTVDDLPAALEAVRDRVRGPGTHRPLLPGPVAGCRALQMAAAGKVALAQGWAHGVEEAMATPPTSTRAT